MFLTIQYLAHCCRRQREENLRLAKLVLDNLPEILIHSEWEEENQQDFEIKMAVLLTEDNIEALISNPQLAMSYNRRLCEGLLLAANNGKAAAIPGLKNVLRSVDMPLVMYCDCASSTCFGLLTTSACLHSECGCLPCFSCVLSLVGLCTSPTAYASGASHGRSCHVRISCNHPGSSCWRTALIKVKLLGWRSCWR